LTIQINYGLTVQPGFNLARIGLTPSDPAAWAGKDTHTYFFSGVKLEAGVFIQTNFFLPCYFEFLYQSGKTKGLNHKDFAANLLIQVISF